jgi:hypothetical protein
MCVCVYVRLCLPCHQVDVSTKLGPFCGVHLSSKAALNSEWPTISSTYAALQHDLTHPFLVLLEMLEVWNY